MTTKIGKYIAAIALVGYIFLALFSLFGFSSHMHAGTPMSDCPYAAGIHSICSMDAFAHIEAWQSLMRIIIPSLLLLIIVVAAAFTWPKLAELSLPVQILRRPERQYSLYTILFSKGILNPKIP